MSDTTFILRGKTFTLSRAAKAALIYVALDVFTTSMVQFGQTLFELKQEEWNSWWTVKRVGWVMFQVGGVITSALLTLKAFFSNSSKTSTPTQ